MKNFKNSVSGAASGCLLVLCVLGCSLPQPPAQTSVNLQIAQPSPTATPRQTALVDIPSLANKPVVEVEKVLGKSVRTAAKTDFDTKVKIGEYRNYPVNGLSDTLQITFTDGAAKSFVMTVPKEKQTQTAAELAALGGFDVSRLSGETLVPITTSWNSYFNGVAMLVTAQKSNVSDYQNLTVQVK